MRLTISLLGLLLFGFCLVSVPGCGSGEPAVAIGSEEEEAAYAEEVYGAEEEDEMEGEDDE